jgi:L-ascorbate metabolism protein UlaG (beta-lactamase superfamily)
MSHVDFLGHATTLIEVDRTRVLTDPLLRPRIAGLVHRQADLLDRLPGEVHAVLISHLHHDHLDVPSLQRLGFETPIVVPRHGGSLLLNAGFRTVSEVEPGTELQFGAVRVRATRAVHIGLRAPLGPWGECVGFVVESPVDRVYFAGDTQAFPEMRKLGAISVALVPVGGWGPVLGPGHMGPEAAVEALRLIRPRVAIPIHWGSLVPFGLHKRTWRYHTQPPLHFASLVAQALPDVHVEVLQPGESFSF